MLGVALGCGLLALLEGGSDWGAGHGLDATTDGGIDHAAGNQPVREVCRLLGRAALGVDGGGGDLERVTVLEPCGARDVEGLFAYLRNATADDLADLAGVDPAALDEPLLDVGQQIGRVDTGKFAIAPPNGERTASTITISDMEST